MDKEKVRALRSIVLNSLYILVVVAAIGIAVYAFVVIASGNPLLAILIVLIAIAVILLKRQKKTTG